MENVWEYLRGNKLSARVWDSYEAIVEACADAWNFFVNDPDRIRLIGTRDWATVNLRAGGITSPFAALRGSDRGLGSALNSGAGSRMANVGSWHEEPVSSPPRRYPVAGIFYYHNGGG
jgi:hypothetical protein